MADQRSDVERASHRVAEGLVSRIEAGDEGYKVGDVLPPYRRLAEEFGVAVNTVMAAVNGLRETGWLGGKPNGRPHVRDRTDLPDRATTLNAIRTELDELRGGVRQAGQDLQAIEDRLAEAVARLAALEG